MSMEHLAATMFVGLVISRIFWGFVIAIIDARNEATIRRLSMPQKPAKPPFSVTHPKLDKAGKTTKKIWTRIYASAMAVMLIVVGFHWLASGY